MSIGSDDRTTQPDSSKDESGSQTSDRSLLLDAQQGVSASYNELVRRHTSRVLNYIFQMTRQRQDAEDLCQQTFLKAYYSLERVDPNRPFLPWLLCIARRNALNHFRGRSNKWEELPADTACHQPTPASQAESSENIGSLWDKARTLLSSRDFEVLWLRIGEELSTEETAGITGLTEAHVRILVFRARQQLMKELSKQ